MQAATKIVPDNFTAREFRATRERPCPICEKSDWCLHGEGWAICQRVESGERWKDAGFLHRLDGATAAPAASGNGARPERKPWIWQTQDEARAACERLPLARDDERARAMFADDYGLQIQDIPDDWRVFVHRALGPGVVYRGVLGDGSQVFKFKSLRRDERGKRASIFLHGAGGWIYGLPNEEPSSDAPVVHAGGEEKCATITAAGFLAVCSLAGEKPLESGPLFTELVNCGRPVVLCNDHDAAGEAANSGTARALLGAGVAPERARVVRWPDGAAAGYDVNDLLKAGGVEAVRRLLLEAPPWRDHNLPRVLPLGEFLAVERPALSWHIENILPVAGKLTFSAASKFGKSFWAIQAGMALASGNLTWLGWRFGPAVKVQYVQGEIMDPLLESRLWCLVESLPPGFDRARVETNFLVQELAGGRPNLFSSEGRGRIERTLSSVKPAVLILDPLQALCPGLEENAAESMSLALDYFAGLIGRFGCAIILVHHHGKSGVSRGSSVFEAWPESDLSASYADPDERTLARVEMRLRCAFNPGAVYWRLPSSDSLWFEAMPPDWTPEKLGRTAKATERHVETVLKAERRAMSWRELNNAVRELCACGERTATTAIRKAVAAGLVKKTGEVYSL